MVSLPKDCGSQSTYSSMDILVLSRQSIAPCEKSLYRLADDLYRPNVQIAHDRVGTFGRMPDAFGRKESADKGRQRHLIIIMPSSTTILQHHHNSHIPPSHQSPCPSPPVTSSTASSPKRPSTAVPFHSGSPSRPSSAYSTPCNASFHPSLARGSTAGSRSRVSHDLYHLGSGSGK